MIYPVTQGVCIIKCLLDAEDFSENHMRKCKYVLIYTLLVFYEKTLQSRKQQIKKDAFFTPLQDSTYLFETLL